MTNILRRIGTTLVTAVVIIATGGTVATEASSTPLASTRTMATASKPYDCAHQGYRGQPAYDAHCLVTGTPRAAAAHWASVNDRDRRAICKHGTHAAAYAIDMLADVTYDHYRNNRQVNAWIGQDATLTCAQLRTT